MPGKHIQFHPEVLARLEELGEHREATLQEIADEAFDDLLKKHGLPVGVRAMFRDSTTADRSALRKEPEKATVSQQRRTRRTRAKPRR